MNERRGPVVDPITQFQYLHVPLPAEGTFHHGLPENHTAFLYLFDGNFGMADSELQEQHLAVLGEGGKLTVKADRAGAHLLLVTGRDIGEPLVQYGPFVMNTREEIEQALADYSQGKLVQAKAGMINPWQQLNHHESRE